MNDNRNNNTDNLETQYIGTNGSYPPVNENTQVYRNPAPQQNYNTQIPQQNYNNVPPVSQQNYNNTPPVPPQNYNAPVPPQNYNAPQRNPQSRNNQRPPQNSDNNTKTLRLIIIILVTIVVFLLIIIGIMALTKDKNNKNQNSSDISEPKPVTTVPAVQSETETLTEAETQAFSEFQREEATWQEAYAQALRDYCKKDCYQEDDGSQHYSMYEITDINGDDVPELIISSSQEHMAFCDIYTFNGRTASQLIRFQGFYGKIDILPNESLIRACDRSSNFEYSDIYSFDGKKFTLIDSFKDSWTSSDDHGYMNNNSIISAEQYDSVIAKYNGKEILSGAGRLYPFKSDITKEQVSFSYAEGEKVHARSSLYIEPAQYKYYQF